MVIMDTPHPVQQLFLSPPRLARTVCGCVMVKLLGTLFPVLWTPAMLTIIAPALTFITTTAPLMIMLLIYQHYLHAPVCQRQVLQRQVPSYPAVRVH